MAKEIKAIVCPQCGATDQEELKPGFYRCSRCQTEYFIDDGNVTVSHLHQWVAPAPRASPARGVIIGLVSVIVAAIVGLGIFTRSDPSQPAVSAYTRPAEPAFDTNTFSWSSARSLPLVAKSEQGANNNESAARPLVLVVGRREYKSKPGYTSEPDPRDGLYAALYDPLTGAEARTQRLGGAPAKQGRFSSSNVEMRVFSNGTVYATVDDSQLYAVDPVTLTVRDVTTSAFARQAPLAAGVATIQFNQERWGDGLELLVNDGKKWYYYPLLDKLYDEDAWYRATHAFTPPGPRAAPRTYFTFTGRSMEYQNAPAQLLKIRYLANSGGPEYRLENPSWSDNYGGSGVFTDADPHVKELIGANDRKTSRILTVADLTPGRRYFDPDVCYADATALLLTLRTTAAPNAPLRLQCLDPTTGAIRWTTPLGPDDKTRSFTRFPGGFVASDGTTCTVYGPDGAVQATKKLEYTPAPAS